MAGRSMTPMRLEIWADVVCPWCWLGEAALLRAVDDVGARDRVRIEMRAFRLDPDPDPERLPTLERLQRKYRLTPEQADAAVARIAQLGAELGLDIHPERTVTAPTSDAHRLIRAAQPQGADLDLMLALHRAYFTDGLDVGDHDVLRAIAGETGLETALVAEVLDSDRHADDVASDELEARMFGVQGVPFVALDRRMAITGAQAPATYAEGLRRALDEPAPGG